MKKQKKTTRPIRVKDAARLLKRSGDSILKLTPRLEVGESDAIKRNASRKINAIVELAHSIRASVKAEFGTEVVLLLMEAEQGKGEVDDPRPITGLGHAQCLRLRKLLRTVRS